MVTDYTSIVPNFASSQKKIIITPDVFGIMVSNDVLEKTEPI